MLGKLFVVFLLILVSIPLISAQCVNPEPGIVAWWQGEDNLNDTIGSNVARFSFPMSYTDGIVNRAFQTSSGFWVNHNENLIEGRQVSVEGWINATSIHTGPIVHRSSSTTGYQFYYESGRLRLSYRNESGNLVSVQTSFGLVTLGNYHHIAFVINTDAEIMEIYVDGNLEASTQTKGKIKPGQDRFLIGSSPFQQHFQGAIDELTLYKVALSPQDIQNIYLANSESKCIHKPYIADIILPNGDTNINYDHQLKLKLGQSPYQINVINGQLPPGLTISPTGRITGTPSLEGNYSFQLEVIDSLGTSLTSNIFSIEVQKFECTSFPNDALAFFSFDGTPEDLIGDADPTQFLGLEFVSGKTNLGLNFSSDTFIRTPSNNLMNSMNELSIELWVLPRNNQQRFLIHNNQILGGIGGLSFIVNNDQSYSFFYRSVIGAKSVKTPPMTFKFFPEKTGFQHVVLTLSPSEEKMRIYVDGQLSAEANASGPALLGGQWIFGTFARNPSFEGLVDEITFYNRSLDPSEIQDLYESNTGGKCPIILNQEFPTAMIGQNLTFNLIGSRGETPYSWSLANGSIPVGMNVDPSGKISGIPLSGGNFEFILRVEDSLGKSMQKIFRQAINLTIPSQSIKVNKFGTFVIPGRETHFALTLKNNGVDSRNTYLTELLEPWFFPTFTYPLASNVTQQFIDWDVDINPGETKYFFYDVMVNENLSTGVTVTGGPACEWTQACKNVAIDCLNPLSEVQGICLTSPWLPTCSPKVLLYTCQPFINACLQVGAFSPQCATSTAQTGAPRDPNQKISINDKFIRANETLSYVVWFENIDNITEARDVFVKDNLSQHLDLDTIEVMTNDGDWVSIGDQQTVTLYEGERIRNISLGNLTILENVTESWNVTLYDSNRSLVWSLKNIDLLPHASDKILFRTKPLSGLSSGTSIMNRANIRFEIFQSLNTDYVENIIDETTPECIVDSLPAISLPIINLTWTGMDAVGNIEEYSIFVAENDDHYVKLYNLTKNKNNTYELFQGNINSTYKFICIAKDTVGHIEQQEPIAETITTIQTTPMQDLDSDGIFDEVDNCPYIFPNPFQEDLDVDGTGDLCDVQTCGNGVLEIFSGMGFNGREECDDGNLQDGDGCSRLCTIEEEIIEDQDDDGIIDEHDVCEFTTLPEGVPTFRLLPNHYANTDLDLFFETTTGDSSYTLAQTCGCSCEQILEIKPGQDLGLLRNGCTQGILDHWISNSCSW